MAKYLWNIGSDSNPVIQGQAGKPFFHQPGPVIRFLSDSASINNSCLCSYKQYRYYKIYATLENSSDSLTFYTLDENGDPERLDPYEEGVQGFLSYNTFSKNGYEWRVSSSYQYLGCFPKGAFECGVWKPIEGFLYTRSDPAHPSPQYIWKETGHPGASILYMIVNSYKCCNRYKGCGQVIDAQQEDPWYDMDSYYCQATYQALLIDSNSVQLQEVSRHCGKGHQEQLVQWHSCNSAKVRVYNFIDIVSDAVDINLPVECSDCYTWLPNMAKEDVLSFVPQCVQWRLWYVMPSVCGIGGGIERVQCDALQNPLDHQVLFLRPKLYEGNVPIPVHIWGQGDGPLPITAHQEKLIFECPPVSWKHPFVFYWKSYPLGQTVSPDPDFLIVSQEQYNTKPQGCQYTEFKNKQLLLVSSGKLFCMTGCCSLRSGIEGACEEPDSDLPLYSDSVDGRDANTPPCNIPDPPRDTYIDFQYTKFNIWSLQLTLSDPGGHTQEGECQAIWQFPQDSDGNLAWTFQQSGYDYEVYHYLPPQFKQTTDLQQNTVLQLTIIVASDSQPPKNLQQLTQRPLLQNIDVYQDEGKSYYVGQNRCDGYWQCYCGWDDILKREALKKAGFGCDYWRYLGQLTGAQLQEHKVCTQKWQVSTIANTFSNQQDGPIGDFVYTIKVPYNVTELCTVDPAALPCPVYPLIYNVTGSAGTSEVFHTSVQLPRRVSSFKYKRFYLDCPSDSLPPKTVSSQWTVLKQLFNPAPQGVYWMQTGFMQQYLSQPYRVIEGADQWLSWGNNQPTIYCQQPNENQTGLPSLVQATITEGTIIPQMNKVWDNHRLVDNVHNCQIYYIHHLQTGYTPVWKDNSNSGQGYCNQPLFKGLQSDSFSFSTMPQIQWHSSCYQRYGLFIWVFGPSIFGGYSFGPALEDSQGDEYWRITNPDFEQSASNSTAFAQLYEDLTLFDRVSSGFYIYSGSLPTYWLCREGEDPDYVARYSLLVPFIPGEQKKGIEWPVPIEDAGERTMLYRIYIHKGVYNPACGIVMKWPGVSGQNEDLPILAGIKIPFNYSGTLPWTAECGAAYDYWDCEDWRSQGGVRPLYVRMQQNGDLQDPVPSKGHDFPWADVVIPMGMIDFSQKPITGYTAAPIAAGWNVANTGSCGQICPYKGYGDIISAAAGSASALVTRWGWGCFQSSQPYGFLTGQCRGIIPQNRRAEWDGLNIWWFQEVSVPVFPEYTKDEYDLVIYAGPSRLRFYGYSGGGRRIGPEIASWYYPHEISEQGMQYIIAHGDWTLEGTTNFYVPQYLASGQYSANDIKRSVQSGHWKSVNIEWQTYQSNTQYGETITCTSQGYDTWAASNSTGTSGNGVRYMLTSCDYYEEPEQQLQTWQGGPGGIPKWSAGGQVIIGTGCSSAEGNCGARVNLRWKVFPGIWAYDYTHYDIPFYPYEDQMCCSPSDSTCSSAVYISVPQPDPTQTTQLPISFPWSWSWSQVVPDHCWIPGQEQDQQVDCNDPRCEGEESPCYKSEGHSEQRECSATFTGTFVLGPAPTTWFI